MAVSRITRKPSPEVKLTTLATFSSCELPLMNLTLVLDLQSANIFVSGYLIPPLLFRHTDTHRSPFGNHLFNPTAIVVRDDADCGR